MILWHDLVVERASYPVPSIHHQTLLAKTIFEHCLDYAQVASIALASKSIQNSSLSPNFASNIVIDEKSVKLFETVLHPSSSLPLQFVPQLKWICDFELLQLLVHSTKYFTKSLRTLTLRNCIVSKFLLFVSQSSDGTESPSVIFSALENLDLDLCEITQDDIDFLQSAPCFPGMQSISICNFDKHITPNFVKLRQLTSLIASGGDLCLKEIATSKPPKLQKLALLSSESLPLTDEGLANLEFLQQPLRSLSLQWAKHLTWSGIKHLASLTNLTSLNLASTIICSDVDWETLLSSFPHLILLDLSYCKITECTFDHIPKLQNLTTLIVDMTSCDCPEITSDHLKKVASLGRLTKLSARDFSVVDDGVLSEWATKLKDLKELNVQGCDNARFHNLPVFYAMTKLYFYCRRGITDDDVARIAVSFPNLKSLDLSSVVVQARITDVGVQSVVSLKCLDTLNLSCYDITDQGLKLIFTLLPLLKSLMMRSGGPGITDKVFEDCADDIRRKVRHLDIMFCEEVTIKTVNLLRSNCRHLRLVSVLKPPTFARVAARQESGCRCVVQ